MIKTNLTYFKKNLLYTCLTGRSAFWRPVRTGTPRGPNLEIPPSSGAHKLIGYKLSKRQKMGNFPKIKSTPSQRVFAHVRQFFQYFPHGPYKPTSFIKARWNRKKTTGSFVFLEKLKTIRLAVYQTIEPE